jgi:aspartate oxidase
VAGLSAEIGFAESRNDLNILVRSKTDREESNTSWAQGGVAGVWDFSKDNFEKHMKDTLVAGDKLCDPEIVKTVVEEDTTNPDEMVLLTQSWKELRDIMSYYVGIVRTNISLTCALDRLHILYKETEELYNSSKLSPQLCEL